jgi:hypothetical protein
LKTFRYFFRFFIVLSFLFISGCTQDNGVLSEPQFSKVSVISNLNQLNYPIDKYILNPDEVLSLYNSLDNRINSCLIENGIKHGFSTFKNKNEALKMFKNDINRREAFNSFYGFFNVETAQTWGYKYSANGNTVHYGSKDDVNTNFSDFPIGTETSVGTKCITNIQNMSPYNSSGAFEVFLSTQYLPDKGPIVPISDSRFVQVQQKWSDCMRGKGYNFDTVKSPHDKFVNAGSVGPATPEEKATAVADVQCKIQTNLVGVAVAVQSAYDEQYIDSHREALAAWRQTLDDYIAGK